MGLHPPSPKHLLPALAFLSSAPTVLSSHLSKAWLIQSSPSQRTLFGEVQLVSIGADPAADKLEAGVAPPVSAGTLGQSLISASL